MITRINLIEKEPFKFTYTKIIKGIFLIMILCALMLSVQWFRLNSSISQLEDLQKRLSELEKEKKDLLKETVPKLDLGSESYLSNVFTRTPRWSELILDISSRLPASIWLTHIEAKTSFRKIEVSSNKKKDKKNNKPDNKEKYSSSKVLNLNGNASSIDDLTHFLSNLSESSFIRNVILSKSIKNENSFNFQLDCELAEIIQ